MKYNYYKHKNRSYGDNYFGRIGRPIKIGIVSYCIHFLFGYRVTKVPVGTTDTEIIVAAALNDGAHPNSYKVQKIRETGGDED